MHHDYQSIFKKIVDRSWFQEYGIVNPDKAMKKWSPWINSRRRRSLEIDKYYFKVCELATGKDKIKQYYYQPETKYLTRFGETTKKVLDRITDALVKVLPKDSGLRKPEYRKSKAPLNGTFNRLALVTQFTDLSSFPYYFQVVDQVTLSAQKSNFSVSVHNVTEEDLFRPVDKIVHTFRPSGIILIRRPPNQRTIDFLAEEEIPLMLINADDVEYPTPIIGNVVPIYPDQTKEKFIAWLEGLKTRLQNPSGRNVVIAAMKPHNELDTHRRKRITFMEDAVLSVGFKPITEYIPDYGFQNALPIWVKHSKAILFISLSDQIARSIKDILMARKENYSTRIVGFDNTDLSEEAAIPSFGQSMEKFGELIIRRFVEEFDRRENSSDYQYAFKRSEVEVVFHSRNNP